MSYIHILSRLTGTPLLISQEKLDIITANIAIPIFLNQRVPSLLSDTTSTDRINTKVDSSVIKVFDSLVSHNGAGDSGSTSYESITTQVMAQINSGNKDIKFYIKSPGGEAMGLFNLTNFINSLPATYGVTTTALVDYIATSAAYAIAASTQKIIATEGSTLGSIGAVMATIDQTVKDQKDGVSYTIHRSKAEKALVNSHESLTPEAQANIDKSLAALDTQFNEAINKYRPQVSLDSIVNLKGATVTANEALTLGLIDSIVPSLTSVLNDKTKLNQIISQPTGTTMAMTLEEALSENIRLSAELQKLTMTASAEIAKAKMEEQTRILGIFDAAKTFKVSMDSAVKFASTGSTIDTAVLSFEAIKEAMQLATNVDTSGADGSTLNKDTLAHLSKDKSELSNYVDSIIEATAQTTESKFY
jgi:ClpP class serine protease